MNEEEKSAFSCARSWVRRSSEPAAWSNLAALYATRQPPDLKRARRWYRRAALKGDDRGLFEYGLMLIQGEGGPKRPAVGRRYLERAAAAGQIDALKVLEYALSHGGYSFDPSPGRAKVVKRALRRALARSTKSGAG
jgi:TPR repeat protein